MLAIGKSKPWPYVLKTMTGSEEMSVAPLKEYYQPLEEWLLNERCSKKYKIGWPGQPANDVKNCPTPTIKSTENQNSAIIVQSCKLGWLFIIIGLLQFTGFIR